MDRISHIWNHEKKSEKNRKNASFRPTARAVSSARQSFDGHCGNLGGLRKFWAEGDSWIEFLIFRITIKNQKQIVNYCVILCYLVLYSSTYSCVVLYSCI